MLRAMQLVQETIPLTASLRAYLNLCLWYSDWRQIILSFCVITTSDAYEVCLHCMSLNFTHKTKLFSSKENLHFLGLIILLCLLPQNSQRRRTCHSTVNVSCCHKHSGFLSRCLWNRRSLLLYTSSSILGLPLTTLLTCLKNKVWLLRTRDRYLSQQEEKP